MRRKNQSAFTLIETLIVMITIILLASIVIPGLFKQPVHDEDSEVELILPVGDEAVEKPDTSRIDGSGTSESVTPSEPVK